MSNIREQVMAALVEEGRRLQSAGVDVLRGLERKFPGTPTEVLIGVWMQVEDEATEAWWQQVERTIDGEVIRAAITNASKAGQC